MLSRQVCSTVKNYSFSNILISFALSGRRHLTTLSGRLTATIALFFLLLSLCSAGELVQLKSRPAAPDFELPDIGGATHRLSDYRGQVVLVNFWATWCAPCRAEMPSLERLKRNFQNSELKILAVNLGETKREISNFYFKTDPQLTFKLLMDLEGDASQYWPMRGVPMTFLIDKDGNVSHVSEGAKRWDTSEVAKVIRELQEDYVLKD